MRCGDNIRKIRNLRGISQAKLAEKVGGGCTQKDVSRWENGGREPNVDSMMKIADALNCSVEEIITGKLRN